MGLDLTRVHIVEDLPNGERRFGKPHPVLALKVKDHPGIMIQNGKLYGVGGDPIKEAPEWLAAELAKCTPEALAECGWGKTEEKKKKAGRPPKERTPDQ